MPRLITGPVTLRVQWDLGRLSANKSHRLHYHEESDVKAAAKTAARVAWLEAGEPYALEKVEFRLVSHRKRRLDDDNLVRGFKPIRDIFFSSRITPDDSAKWVKLGGVDQELLSEGFPYVEVVVQPANYDPRLRIGLLEQQLVELCCVNLFFQESLVERGVDSPAEAWGKVSSVRRQVYLDAAKQALTDQGLLLEPEG